MTATLAAAQPVEVDQRAARLARLLGLGGHAVPLIMPMLWVGAPRIREGIWRLVPAGRAPLQVGQTFVYRRPLKPGERLALSVTGAVEESLLTLESSVVDAAGADVVSFTTRIALPRISDLRRVASGRAAPPSGPPEDAVALRLDQDSADAYAELSGDDNPLHSDPGAARRAGLSGTILQGMLVAGLAEQALPRPDACRRLDATFVRAVECGQRIFVSAREVAGPAGPVTRVRVADAEGRLCCTLAAQDDPTR